MLSLSCSKRKSCKSSLWPASHKRTFPHQSCGWWFKKTEHRNAVVLLTSRFPSISTRLTGGVCANDNTAMQQPDTDMLILASRGEKKRSGKSTAATSRRSTEATWDPLPGSQRMFHPCLTKTSEEKVLMLRVWGFKGFEIHLWSMMSENWLDGTLEKIPLMSYRIE